MLTLPGIQFMVLITSAISASPGAGLLKIIQILTIPDGTDIL